jgi:hypothetical protein
MRGCVWTIGAGLLLAGLAVAGQQPATQTGHLLVLVSFLDGRFTLEQVDRVAGPLPKQRADERPRPWRLRLVDAKGRQVHQAGLDDPTELRGEFHDRRDPSRIESVHLKQPGEVFFSVRLPAGSAGRLEFDRLGAGALRQPNPPATAWERIGTLELGKPGARP